MEIQICTHCHSQMGGGTAKHCSFCKTAEQRKEMDTENKKLNHNFVCHECELNQNSINEHIVDNSSVDTSTGSFIPNWKRNGLESKDVAFAKILRLIANLPGTFYFQNLLIENQTKLKKKK